MKCSQIYLNVLKNLGAMTGGPLQGGHCPIYSHGIGGQIFSSHTRLLVPLLTNSGDSFSCRAATIFSAVEESLSLGACVGNAHIRHGQGAHAGVLLFPTRSAIRHGILIPATSWFPRVLPEPFDATGGMKLLLSRRHCLLFNPVPCASVALTC